MIYTVTFNPAIDYVIEVDNFTLGEMNRIRSDCKYPGGKGINVSRVLNNFGIKSRALGFVGGFTGEYVKDFLEKEGIQTDFIRVSEDTRINIKLKSIKETEVNGPGPHIGGHHLEMLFNQIEKLCPEDYIVLAGNVQSGVPRYIYSQLMTKCRNARFVVDATGETLLHTLANKPFLIKPNAQELGELFDTCINNKEAAISYGKKLLHMGAENVIISMAASGAVLICKDCTYYASAPEGKVQNSVGAGDSLIGGFLARYSVNEDMVDAFRWGVAAGSATAFSLDLCTKKQVETLVGKIKTNKIF